MTLIDYIPTLKPKYVRPFHLGRLCDALDKVGSEPMRRVFWHGPRCGVTTAIKACTRMHVTESVAYAAKGISLTDHVLHRLSGSVHPGDRLIAGNSVTGAYFLDGYIPTVEQWEHMLTRLSPRASIFVFMDPLVEDFETKKRNFLAELKHGGFAEGWV